ncbi:hypothetical protein [Streptomyces formicae]
MGVTKGGSYTAVIEVAREPDGSFGWTNLTIAAGTVVGPGDLKPAPFPSLTSGFAAIGWGSDSLRVYYADTAGAVVELATNGNDWNYRNFTSSIGAPAAAWNSPLAADRLGSGKMAVYYVDENRNLTVLLFDGGWKLGTNPKLPKVASSSPLAAMQNDRGRFVYYFDDDNHIREVEEFGRKTGQSTDLTDYVAPGFASFLSGLAAVGWGKDARRVYYADSKNHLIELAGFGDTSGWSWRDLSGVGARQLMDGSPLAAATADGAFPSVGQWCREGRPLLLRWTGGGWSSMEIYSTDKGTRPVAAVNSSVACALSPDDALPWLSFVTGENHLALWRGPELSWLWWDLTADLDLSPVAKVATQGPLAFAYTERGPRIYYLSDEPEF